MFVSSHSTCCRLVSLSLFVALVCLGPRVVLLVVVLSPSPLSYFVLLNTLSYSAHSWLVSVSIFLPLFFSTPCAALLVVDSSRLFQPFVICVETSTRSASCSVVSGGYLNTLTCKLMFHSPKLLSIRPFCHHFQFGCCLAAFCIFVIAFLKRLPSTQPLHAVAKRTVVDAYIYICILEICVRNNPSPVCRIYLV